MQTYTVAHIKYYGNSRFTKYQVKLVNDIDNTDEWTKLSKLFGLGGVFVIPALLVLVGWVRGFRSRI